MHDDSKNDNTCETYINKYIVHEMFNFTFTLDLDSKYYAIFLTEDTKKLIRFDSFQYYSIFTRDDPD